MAEGYPAERFQVAAAAPKQAAALIRFGHHPDDERERAALALCEAATRIDRDGVPDDVWAEGEEHFEVPGNYAPADREAAPVGADR